MNAGRCGDPTYTDVREEVVVAPLNVFKRAPDDKSMTQESSLELQTMRTSSIARGEFKAAEIVSKHIIAVNI